MMYTYVYLERNMRKPPKASQLSGHGSGFGSRQSTVGPWPKPPNFNPPRFQDAIRMRQSAMDHGVSEYASWMRVRCGVED